MMCENKTAISKYRHIISAITADYFAHGRRIIRSVQPDYTRCFVSIMVNAGDST